MHLRASRSTLRSIAKIELANSPPKPTESFSRKVEHRSDLRRSDLDFIDSYFRMLVSSIFNPRVLRKKRLLTYVKSHFFRTGPSALHTRLYIVVRGEVARSVAG